MLTNAQTFSSIHTKVKCSRKGNWYLRSEVELILPQLRILLQN